MIENLVRLFNKLRSKKPVQTTEKNNLIKILLLYLFLFQIILNHPQMNLCAS